MSLSAGWYLGLAAIHDEGNFTTQTAADVEGVGGRNAIGNIGAGRGERKAAFANDGLNERMGRPADADSGAAGGDGVRDILRAGQNERERPRPESGGEGVREGGPLGGATPGHFQAGDVHDDRVVGRAALDFEDALHGPGVEGVGGEPINRFSGQSHNAAGAQQLHGAGHGRFEQGGGMRRQNFRS